MFKLYNRQNNVIINNIILHYFYQMFQIINTDLQYWNPHKLCLSEFHVKKYIYIWCPSLIFAHLKYLYSSYLSPMNY